MNSKQVIVMKKFPKARNLRTGKYCAQAAHAAMGAVFQLGKIEDGKMIIDLSDPAVHSWITGRFTKITVYVETDQDLFDIQYKAQRENIPCALIQDAGLTEFDGVPTYTAVAVGPASAERIDAITGHLPLF